MPDVPFPINPLGNGYSQNGGFVPPQTPVVLSPQQHAVLQVLAQHIAALTPNPLYDYVSVVVNKKIGPPYRFDGLGENIQLASHHR